MNTFEITLAGSALLCSLVAGFLFAYAIVIMPGIKNLDDKQLIKAFQITDLVIQNNQPVFIVVWMGSALSLILCAFAGLVKLQGLDFSILLLATLGYLVGVQGATIAIHLPLNKKLQGYDIEAMTDEEISEARIEFEPRWNRSNERRTIIACVVSLLLIVLALRL